MKIDRTKRRRVLIRVWLSAAAVIFGILAGVWHEKALRGETAARYAAEHSFGELVTAVTELDAALEKSLWATGPAAAAGLCTQVYARAVTAQMSLSALPFDTGELESLSGFLSRVGDYAFALSRAAAAGRGYTPEQREALRGLSGAAGTLALNLRSLRLDVQDGSVSPAALSRAARTLEETAAAAPRSLGESLKRIEQEFPELPSLVYDGPFSEHLTGLRPRALEGLEEVSQEEARAAAAALLNLSPARIVPDGDCEGELPCYRFSADGAGGAKIVLRVTKQGGRVLSMLSSRPAGTARLGPEEAVEAARRFLEAAGYRGMAETYHMARDGVLTVNFAWRQGSVLCYSDLVKVSVALDTGAVCGFEAKGYLMAHCERVLPEIAVSAEEAAAALSPELEPLSAQTALVPSDGPYETLCHELKCAGPGGRRYLVYVSAVTGEQEKILILLEDENGTLTI